MRAPAHARIASARRSCARGSGSAALAEDREHEQHVGDAGPTVAVDIRGLAVGARQPELRQHLQHVADHDLPVAGEDGPRRRRRGTARCYALNELSYTMYEIFYE
jgi:hypothetical protein